MLDNFRYVFKMKSGNMDFNEEQSNINLVSVFDSFIFSNTYLCERNKNKLSITINDQIPLFLSSRQIMFKRTINNLISNALKHT